MSSKFVLFYGGIFSQWHPCSFEVRGIKYNCAEQYMMHQKALLFDDFKIANEILLADHPKDQKALGKFVLNKQKQTWSEEDVDFWNANARHIVYDGNWHKFNQNPDLKAELLSHKDCEFVEASPYDTIWGIGLSENDVRALDKDQWRGTNWLGKALDQVRDDFYNNKYTPYIHPSTLAKAFYFASQYFPGQ